MHQSFNNSHPELKPGEIFAGNTANGNREFIDLRKKGKRITVPVRLGKAAYDVRGDVVYGLFPMFIRG